MTVESRLTDVEDRLQNLRNADRLQGRRFSAEKPSDGAVPVWNDTTKKWEPQARPTRKMPMSILSTPSHGADANISFPDGSTTRLHSAAPVPSDWVSGTDLTLIVHVHKAGVNSETAVMLSYIAAQNASESFSYNIESAVSFSPSIPASDEIRTLERTIPGADVSAGEYIEWVLRRQGGSGSDTLNEVLFVDSVWLEYTAFF